MVEELKRTPSKMTIFDALRILGQINLLQEALKLKNGRKRTSVDNVILVIFDDIPRAPINIRRCPLFYISLRLEGWVVNNDMIDTRATITIISRAFVEAMKLYII